jgi:hypothetical protein
MGGLVRAYAVMESTTGKTDEEVEIPIIVMLTEGAVV